LFKAKEGENFNHPSTICRTYGAGRNTFSISRINPPKLDGGLKFEPDTGIGQKGAFFKGLSMCIEEKPGGIKPTFCR
jgi:hypothetical protein